MHYHFGKTHIIAAIERSSRFTMPGYNCATNILSNDGGNVILRRSPSAENHREQGKKCVDLEVSFRKIGNSDNIGAH